MRYVPLYSSIFGMRVFAVVQIIALGSYNSGIIQIKGN